MCGLILSCFIEVNCVFFQFSCIILGIDLAYEDFSKLVGIEIESKFTLVSILSCMFRGQILHVNKLIYMFS